MWQCASPAVWRGRVSEVQVGGGQSGVSHHFRFLLWCFTFHGNVVWKVKQGFVREGVTLFAIDRVTDRILWVWGVWRGALDLLYVAHRRRGPKVMPPGCHLWKGQWDEGEDKGGPLHLLWHNRTHTNHLDKGIHRGSWCQKKNEGGGEKKEGLTNGQLTACDRRLTGRREGGGRSGRFLWHNLRAFAFQWGEVFVLLLMPAVKLPKRRGYWITHILTDKMVNNTNLTYSVMLRPSFE